MIVNNTNATINVLYVDDDPALVDLVAEYLSRENELLDVETATVVDDALDRFHDPDADVDCIVSDHEMSGMDGLSFLRAVRETDPHLPFLIYTGRGSEEVAQEAISQGVTDYMQKARGMAQYAVLANRIVQAVEKYRAERDTRRRLLALETAWQGICIVDRNGEVEYANSAFLDLYDYREDELLGRPWEDLYPLEEADRFHDEVLAAVHDTGGWVGESVGIDANGDTFPQTVSLAELPDGGFVAAVDHLDDSAPDSRFPVGEGGAGND
jgi:PAS domain S-box-containing protein